MNLTTEDYERVEARIAEMKVEIPQKAATDPEFHDALKANPPATIEKYYGFPEGLLKEIDLRIFEEAPGSIGIVIPPRPSTNGEELSEEELEAIAGGQSFNSSHAIPLGVRVAASVIAVTSPLTMRGNGAWSVFE